jgi:hypothetical protein
VTLCAICTVHVEMRSAGFLVELQNKGCAVCQWFGPKTTGMVFSGLTSKPVVTVFSGLSLKPVVMVFSGLASKSVATVFWLSLKTKVVEGFLVVALKPVATIS